MRKITDVGAIVLRTKLVSESTTMRLHSIGILAVFMLTVSSAQTDDGPSASISYILKECDNKLLHIDSLGEFETFMKHYDIMKELMQKPKRGLLNTEKGLRKCFDLEEELRALQDIVAHRNDGVCQMQFIDRLYSFHVKYIVKQANGDSQQPVADFTVTKYDYTAHIFSLIAHQVAYVCKSKLIARITSIEANIDCSNIVGLFLPQVSMTHDEELISMSSFLKNFRRVEDLALVEEHAENSAPELYFDIIVPPSVLAKIKSLKEKCCKCKPFYNALFRPIVTLSQLGYEIREASVDTESDDSADSRILQSWLSSAQLCQGILKTHVNASAQEGESEKEQYEKKLVGIKFGQVPDDVKALSDLQSHDMVEFKGDSLDEISTQVVDIVKKQKSTRSKAKRTMIRWVRKFVRKHIDIDAIREDTVKVFIDALTTDESQSDSSVAFSGKKKNQGKFLPSRLVTDDADTIFQAISLFTSKPIALLMSSVVAICLSAVFLWFLLYASVASIKGGNIANVTGNFKDEWRRLEDERMKTIQGKINRWSWKDKLMVYKSPTGW